ncbi:NUDIX hydrolase [Saccharothrix sp. NRRL B-16348]|uniref:NUDIX hydrolase n=1 Tax=Saccharothrix sp. NRRL B-16348 TaxID=1415542 RepID=UPI0006B01C6C|nr:NUDIX hydrolase [Saccharothrix sp. NRRL B-16348]
MTDDPTRWTVRGTRRVYASEWVNVDLDDVDIPGGPRFEHHVLRFPRASTGAVVTDREHVLLLWRHRFTTDTWGWEIPAGWSEQGEDPAEAVVREVREETGYEPHDITPLITYSPMTGISSQQYHVYLARAATLIGPHEAAEVSRVEWTPVSDLPRLIATGQITDGPSLTALAVYLTTTGPHH